MLAALLPARLRWIARRAEATLIAGDGVYAAEEQVALLPSLVSGIALQQFGDGGFGVAPFDTQ